ncbi:MAG: hypothetical protein QXP92_04920 [Nitrososphaerota archaeon]
MRLKKTLLLIMILVISLFSAFYCGVMGEEVVERLIEVDKYGFVYVVDKIPVKNGYIEVGFPRVYLVNLVDYYSPDGSIELKVEDQVFWLKVTSVSPSTSIRLISIFGDLPDRSGEETFKIRFPANPLTRENLEKVNVKIVLPEESNITKISPKTVKVSEKSTEAYGEISGDTTQALDIDLEFEIGKISLVKPAVTYLTLDLSTRQAEYTVKLSLRDGKTIDSFYFNLPNGSRLLEVRDYLKKLSNSYDENTGKLRVSFDRTLRIGESQTVIIRFEPPADFFYKVSGNAMTVSSYLPFNLSVQDYRVSIVLPSMEYVSSDLEPIEIKKIYPEKTLLTFYLGIVSPLNVESKKFNVVIERVPSLFSLIPYILGISIIVLVIGTIMYSQKTIFKPSLKEYEETAKKLLEEVDGLMATCKAIGELIDAKKILDKGYVRPRILEIRNSVARYVGRIASHSVDLKKTYPDIAEKIDSLTTTSRLILEAVEYLWTQTHRYLTGSIAKPLFIKQAEEKNKEILKYLDKLVSDVESLKKATT